MTTTTTTLDLAGVVEAAISGWAERNGAAVSVGAVVAGLDGDLGADPVAVVATLGGDLAGRVGLAAPAGFVDPPETLEGLVAEFAARLGEAHGASVTVTSVTPVGVDDLTAIDGDTFTAQITGAEGDVPTHWYVEPALAARSEDDPVASSGPQGVAPASYPDLRDGHRSGALRDLSVLADVAMEVTVELGRAELRVRELLSLVEGSIVELDRPADSEVAVYVNGTLVARGEVVVVDDELGVRITEVVSRP